MSHFSVAIFTDGRHDIETLLAPYWEGTEDPMYTQFVKGETSVEEMRGKYEEEARDCEDFIDFVKRWYGYDYNPASDTFGYVCNPEAKWDWYEEGGRFSDMLKKKGDSVGRFNSLPVSEIDFSIDEDEYRKAERFWEVYVDKEPLTENENEEDFRSWYKPEYFLEQYETKCRYAKERASLGTWAFVTPDGRWYEAGEMGWFAANDATASSRIAYAKAFEDAVDRYSDCIMTIVDCHI